MDFVGDIVFCHTTGVLGKAIRVGEWLRFKRGSEWNHVAIIDRIENGVPYIIQAEAKGVTSDKPLDSIAPNGHYIIVKQPEGIDRFKTLEFARAQVGKPYGFLTIAFLVIDILTPNWFPAFRRKRSWICSALVMESLRYGGWFHDWDDIYIVTPAQAHIALFQSK